MTTMLDTTEANGERPVTIRGDHHSQIGLVRGLTQPGSKVRPSGITHLALPCSDSSLAIMSE